MTLNYYSSIIREDLYHEYGPNTHLNINDYTELCYTALDCTTLHCLAMHCTTLHCTLLHLIALHYTALHITAPQCTALHSMTGNDNGELSPICQFLGWATGSVHSTLYTMQVGYTLHSTASL